MENNSESKATQHHTLELWVLINEPVYGYLRTSISSRFFHQIVDFAMKSSLVYQKLFCLVALPVFEKYFRFGSGTSDYTAMLNSSSMKTNIQLSRDNLPNKLLMLNDDFWKIF